MILDSEKKSSAIITITSLEKDGTFYFGWCISSGPDASGGGSIETLYKQQTDQLAQYEAMACALWSLNQSMHLSELELTIKCDNWDVVLYMKDKESTPMECRDVCRATVDTCISIIPRVKWRLIAKNKNRCAKQAVVNFLENRTDADIPSDS